MRVAVFGGTGFIGGYVTERLAAGGHTPVLLVRPGSERNIHCADGCVIVPGDLEDTGAVSRTLDGADAAIYAIGILREYPFKRITFEDLHVRGVERTASAAVGSGVGRFLLISANGVEHGRTEYQRTKLRGENVLRSLPVDWTILRPSIVYGDPRGSREFMTLIRNEIVFPPFPAPLFTRGFFPSNAGRFQFSPVHVCDLAEAVVRAVESPEVSRKILHIGGPAEVDWKTLLETIAAVTGRRKLMLPVPGPAVIAVASLLERFSFFPASRDELVMLLDGNTCDGGEAAAALGIDFRGFTPEHLSYLRL